MAASPTRCGSISTGSRARFSRRAIRRRASRTFTAFWCPAASASGAPRARSRPPIRPRAAGALFRHLFRHADGGDRGRRRSPASRHALDRVRPDRRAGRRADDRMDAGQRAGKRAAEGDLGGTMRLGAYRAVLKPGRGRRDLRRRREITERHRHRYEVNIAYRERLEDEGMMFTGMSPDGLLPETSRSPSHPWFIGVQFHPELKCRPSPRTRCSRASSPPRRRRAGWCRRFADPRRRLGSENAARKDGRVV